MRTFLNALTLVMLAPSSALAVVDNYTECKTLMGFVVELGQTTDVVPVGSSFTVISNHASTAEQLTTLHVSYDDMLLRKVEIDLETSEYSLPMVLVDSLYNFPYPQGANSVAVYDLTGRKFHTSDDLARDGLQSVPLNCYPVSGLY
jgi:hypothetical protein